LVLGADSLRQLEQLVVLASEPGLTLHQAQEVRAAFPSIPKRLLNPSHWNA
jgi:hypothetical protein